MGFSSLFSATGRNYGGTADNLVADPYLTGYHFTKWFMPNKSIFFDTIKGLIASTKLKGPDDVPSVLDVCCLSVTPPGGTLNKTEIQGLGGTKWSVPTSVDYTTSFSCKFLEFQYIPVFSIIHSWVKYIRDNKTGTTDNANELATHKNEYSASVLYWTTKPDGKTIEYAACYSGVFPLKDPQDLFQSDVASVDKLEMDIEFNVDFVYHEKWVYDKAISISESYSKKLQEFRSSSNASQDFP